MRHLLIIVFLAQGHLTFGQDKLCDCPKNDLTISFKADKIFTFSNGASIGVCGFIDTTGKDTIYSEFILYQCGKTAIIDKWDATKTCKILTLKDTLFIQEIYGLAISNQMEIKSVPFYITKYYFDNNFLRSTSYFRNDIPKYSLKKINKVIIQYKNLTVKSKSETKLLIAHRLFWAFASGNKEASNYLDSFKNTFGPFDGAVSEEFHELWETYQHYKL